MLQERKYVQTSDQIYCLEDSLFLVLIPFVKDEWQDVSLHGLMIETEDTFFEIVGASQDPKWGTCQALVNLTCMSKYQLREWQHLMFSSITCFWSIYSLKKCLIPEISPGGPQRGGLGRDEKITTSSKLILHVWGKISWKICDALWCPLFGGPRDVFVHHLFLKHLFP